MSVFFTSRKTILKSWLDTFSIASCLSSPLSFFISQSQQLFDTWWIDRESSYLLNYFSIIGGQIKLLLLHLMDYSSTPPRYLYLSPTISSIPSSIAASIPLDTCIYRDLLRLYNLLMRSAAHFLRSLSKQLSHFLSQTLSSHSNLNPQGFFKLFQVFPHLVSFLSLIIHAFHVLKPRFWGFSKLMSCC